MLLYISGSKHKAVEQWRMQTEGDSDDAEPVPQKSNSCLMSILFHLNIVLQ